MSFPVDLNEVYFGTSVAENITRVYKGRNLIFERGVGPILDPSTQALLDQAALDGFTAASGSVLTALNTAIVDLKAQNIWTNKDAIWVFATNGDNNFALYNIKDPSSIATRINSPVFVPLEGYTFDGVSSYIDSNYNLSTGTNYTLNSGGFTLYTRINANTGGFGTPLGAETSAATDRNLIIPRNGLTISINSNSVNFITGENTKIGYFQLYRTNSTTESYKVNDDAIGSITRASSALANANLYVGALNRVGVPTLPYPGQVSIVTVGGDTSSTAQQERDIFQDYMIALGTQV